MEGVQTEVAVLSAIVIIFVAVVTSHAVEWMAGFSGFSLENFPGEHCNLVVRGWGSN